MNNLTQPLPKGYRLLSDNECVRVGDLSRWSNAPRDTWMEIHKGGIYAYGLPVCTLRERHGQDALMFATKQD